MIALEIVTDEIPALKLTDTADRAAALFDQHNMTHLPVVNEHDICSGILSESDVYGIESFADTLSKHKKLIIPLMAEETEHVFQVITKMTNANTTCLPVVNDKNRYCGTVTINKLMQIIGDTALIRDEGGVIELEMNIVDYSLSEIARIVESNNAKILGSYIRNHDDSKKIHVTLKINKTDLTAVIKTFERYEYDISASFHQSENEDALQDRFNNLMNYLNL